MRDGVVRSATLRAAGVSNHAVSKRTRPSGPWHRMLPGVVLLSNDPPTRRQLLRAALAYAGTNAVISGADALCRQGVEVPSDGDVLVLIPAGRRAASRAYLTVERTTRLPEPVWHDGLPLAPVVRAALDAARHERDRDRLRAVLFAPVRAGACTMAELRAELDAGNQRGSAAPRALLAKHGDEVVPTSIGLARRLIRDGPLPPPQWRIPLHDEDGVPLGVADAWWDEIALAWHIGAPRVEDAAMTATGVVVVCTEPHRIRGDPHAVLHDLCSAFSLASRRPRPAVRAW
jgi:hypothetical protein